MNNKGNIFEELNKMKGLIHAKAGTVISEQLLNSAGQPQTIQGVGAGKKLTSNQMLVTSKGFGNVTPEMADQLVKSGKINSSSIILPAQRTAMKDEAQKELDKGKVPKEVSKTMPLMLPQRLREIGTAYCSRNPYSLYDTWEKFRTENNVTASEIESVAKLCPAGYKFGDDLSKTLNIQGKDETQKSNTQKGGTNTVNTRFVKSATDLGIQSGKMDLQTLQSILAKLQDDGSQSTVTQDTSTTTQQTPDLAQLTSLLNQLKA
jgi:hypothetical protein